MTADLALIDGPPLPIAELLRAGSSNAEVLVGLWDLCQQDANYYTSFRMPLGR